MDVWKGTAIKRPSGKCREIGIGEPKDKLGDPPVEVYMGMGRHEPECPLALEKCHGKTHCGSQRQIKQTRYQEKSSDSFHEGKVALKKNDVKGCGLQEFDL